MHRTSPRPGRPDPDRDSLRTSRSRTRVLLEDRRRRSAFAALADASELTLEELVDAVADGGPPTSPARHQPGSLDRTRLALSHSDLPKLADVGLVEHEGDGNDLVVRVPSSVDDEATLARVDRNDGCEALRYLLVEPWRETVVSLLDAADGPVAVDDLANALAAIDRDDGSDPPEPVVASVRLALRHVDLPGLDDVGVVDYDPDRRTVAIAELPATWDPIRVDERLDRPVS